MKISWLNEGIEDCFHGKNYASSSYGFGVNKKKHKKNLCSPFSQKFRSFIYKKLVCQNYQREFNENFSALISIYFAHSHVRSFTNSLYYSLCEFLKKRGIHFFWKN